MILDQIITSLVGSGPVAAVLVAALYWLVKDRAKLESKLDKRDEDYYALLERVIRNDERFERALRVLAGEPDEDDHDEV